MRKSSRLPVFALSALLILSPEILFAGRCGTGLRAEKPERFVGHRPAFRHAGARQSTPVAVTGAHVLSTEHFRVLWGDGFDRTDPQWVDADGDGYPEWVEVWAEALEKALVTQRSLGFPDPFGLDRYFLDAYVGNTGLVVGGKAVTISSSYYAYTEVDSNTGVAYFVVNDDFSAHASDELGVVRATAAHELFHAVQQVLYPWADEVQVPASRWGKEGWWFEATATWMEEVCEPEVDDYVAYVRTFLSHPEEPLTSTDGLREYGAAIFPGFLWLRRGGPSLWVRVFRDAFSQGLENALRTALEAGGHPGLAETVAAFWSLAAHPEDGWPDGARFRSANAPSLFRVVSQYPVDVSTTSSDAPGRFGATLVRLPTSPSALPVQLTNLAGRRAEFFLAASAAAHSDEPLVLPAPGAGATLAVPGDSDGFLAVVNASDDEGPAAYRLVMGEAAQPRSSASGGGGGGCFLASLR